MSLAAKAWLVVASLVMAVLAIIIAPIYVGPASGEFWDRIDQQVIDQVDGLRTGWLTSLSHALNTFSDDTLISVARWIAVGALLAFKRWRHLGVFVGSILVVQLVAAGLANQLARARPDGIEILADWSGFAQPSQPMAAVALTLLGVVLALVVPGPARRRALIGVGILLFLLGLSRIYLGVDRLTDALSGAALGVVAPLLAFWIWTPDAVFPVSYRRGKTAHLHLDSTRRQAILSAVRDQLGLDAVDLRPYGMEGSAGSTPLRIQLSGEEPRYVFAKLYAQNHLRSDRWYKLGRTLMYGALEDEIPFKSVRKLAEREDYLMRLAAEAGVPTPRPLGVVEITPGREYVTVTEFIADATEISEAEVDSDVVDAGFRIIRRLWDAGLAHRDIKPANLLVRDGELFLIDVAFGEVRPTPWRQAVDLANMMLTLSLRHPVEAVYRTALEHFDRADISEASAVTRGVTMPSELRSRLKAADQDLLAAFRERVPDRKPIRIQRWTRRRLTALAGSALVAAAGLWLAVQNITVVRGLL